MAFKSNKTNQTLNFKLESISLVKRIVSITNSVKCFAFARHSCREKRGISPCMQPNFIKRLALCIIKETHMKIMTTLPFPLYSLGFVS